MVEVHEKLLPESETHQNAVVYDLQIPDILANQRDALQVLVMDLCKNEIDPIQHRGTTAFM